MMTLAESHAPGLLRTGRSALKQARETVKKARHGLKALEARFKRSRSRATFIAVTGSSGKTTTVSLLTHILSADSKVRTQVVRNGFDNAVTTLRRLTKEDQFIVIEMGTSGPGRLKKVTRLVKPDISIVTLVALEHFPAFQSLEEVAEEKAIIVRALPETGLAILNADDANVRAMSGSTSARVTLFGSADGGCQVANVRTSAEGTLALTIRHGNRSMDLETQLIGAHNWLPVCCCRHVRPGSRRLARNDYRPGRQLCAVADALERPQDCGRPDLHTGRQGAPPQHPAAARDAEDHNGTAQAICPGQHQRLSRQPSQQISRRISRGQECGR